MELLVVAVIVVIARAIFVRRGSGRLLPVDYNGDPGYGRALYTALTGKSYYRPVVDPTPHINRYLDLLEQVADLELEEERLRAQVGTAREDNAVAAALAGSAPDNDEALLAARRGDAEPAADYRPVYFKPEEPRRFADFEGQRHITVPLQKAVAALADDERVIDHKLLTGQPGRGKTLLAKVLGHELDQRAYALGLGRVPFFEYFGANLNSVEALDALAAEVRGAGGGLVFIDEIHVLNKELATKLYAWMEEARYPFAGAPQPAPMPPTVIVGATTDYGALHNAQKRRFGEPLMVQALSQVELRKICDSLGQGTGLPIDADAADLLVSRTYRSGAPWELKVLFREASVFAKAARRPRIALCDVQEVLDVYDIDALGLRPIDRSVIAALFKRPRTKGKDQTFVCYGASEQDICAMAGIDRGEFQENIRARLMSRGLLEVRSGYGLALVQPFAVTTYPELNVPQV